MDKVRLHRYILTPALLVILLFGCTGGSQYRAMLERADSLMATHPDSAYALLKSMAPSKSPQGGTCISTCNPEDKVAPPRGGREGAPTRGWEGASPRRGLRMRYELLLAEAQNKLGHTFRTDSVLREVADYYNSPWRRFINSLHQKVIPPPYGGGVRGEALKSLYLLGCAYRDLHEAPIALLTWEDAIAAADTAAADCDYATLFRVYGQMAEIYKWQHLPEMQLEAQKNYSKFALLAGDTLNYLRGQLLCNSAYYALGDTAAIFANSEAVRKQYLDLDLTKEAAKVYPTPIHVAVENGQYERARKMMDEYEQHSGLFDSNGNIKDSTRAQYHYYKGVYYLGIHLIDSAEWQFRKLCKVKNEILDAYRGLFMLYQNIHYTDSAFKYGRLYEDAMGRFLDNQNGDAIIQAQAMYDYHRQKEIADNEHQKNQRVRRILIIICLATVLTFIYLRRRMKAKAAAMGALMEAYSQNEDDLEKARVELRYLKNHLNNLEASGHDRGDDSSSQLLVSMTERIRTLEEQLRHDAILLGKLEFVERDERLMNDDAVKQFQRICHTHQEGSDQKKPRRAHKSEWEALQQAIKREHLSCYIAIKDQNVLTPQEQEVAFLSRIGLQTQEMATIIGCSSQSISNARSNISEKLFSSKETLKINRKLKDL